MENKPDTVIQKKSKSIGLGITSLIFGIFSIIIALQFLAMTFTDNNIVSHILDSSANFFESIIMYGFLAIIIIIEIFILLITSLLGIGLGFGGIYQKQGAIANVGTILSALSLFTLAGLYAYFSFWIMGL